MRSKEDAHDYRYFPDPDLLPLEVSDLDIARVQAELPELQAVMQDRFMRSYSIPANEARILTSSREIAEYFEQATNRLVELNPAKWESPKLSQDAEWMYGGAIAKGVVGLLMAQLNRDVIDIDRSRVTPSQFAVLHARHIDNTLNAKAAREIFQVLWEENDRSEDSVDRIIQAKGLKQISDSGELEKIVEQVIAANAQQVADYKGGKEKAFNSLVGQAMKLSKGKANPQQVSEILKKKLGG
jgi:aspartyl-tRNA(Asn)/glutamyl-tRNA(Gln) amidotransferase subunit B